ncbi:bifunctional folylpolyglutamate synthase/dihydrofolate synthase [Mediterraneibacter agrestimuris]|uniref:bifunctional folylpolyglutamate synthase/dihydrofolate synthase n=1 Tax=Mediterraneibacter agrestimuris TaxID=2941333 RepID=UPI002041045A|nr:folylpolyglutamate synthase/dihydrofolate synthase family protein [Mediterraneibacter agrestimuris]
MTYKEARVYLDEVSKYGSVLGLDAIRGLLCELGNPQDDLKFIHIAGTNGKGSVLAYTSTILSEAGLKTGRYVSPTVLSYLERIQVDGQWISEEIFAELVEEVQRAVARMETDGKASPTVFEIETAIAFLYFRKMKCDVVVLETGLGGRLDATNVVKNTEIAVFVAISRDHMGFLGETLEEIAENKAGIIKPGCTVVSAVQEPCVRAALEREAQKYGCTVIYAEPEKAEVIEENYLGQTFAYKGMEAIQIGLAGRYQIGNAVTAWEVVQAWNHRISEAGRISEQAVCAGFAKTKWPGRFTCISENPVFIVDGAHNEDAARRLKESVEIYFPKKKLTYIMGVFKDKEYEKIVELMIPYAKRVYTVDLPDGNRSLSSEVLRDVIKKASDDKTIEAKAVGTVEDAVQCALQNAGNEDVILAFGSLSYLGRVMMAAEVFQNMRKRK